MELASSDEAGPGPQPQWAWEKLFGSMALCVNGGSFCMFWRRAQNEPLLKTHLKLSSFPPSSWFPSLYPQCLAQLSEMGTRVQTLEWQTFQHTEKEITKDQGNINISET